MTTMVLNDFITRWNGKYVDTDNAYGAQCMDLMHQYCVEVLGLSDLSILAAPCAADVYNNFSSVNGHLLFDQIKNTPTGVPQEGDIMFWNIGTYGHVAVFVEGDTNSFRSFDQNYPTGSPCHIQNHSNYTGVLGWLRYKTTNSQMVQVESKVFENLVRKSTIYDAIFTKLNVVDSQTIVLAEIGKLVGYEDAVAKKDQQIADAQATISLLQKTALDKETELKTLQTDMDALKLKNQADMAALNARVEDAVSENKSLQVSLQKAQEAAQMPILSGWKKWIFDTFIK